MTSPILSTPDILILDVNKSFNNLTENEKAYLYSIDEVAWVGGLIDLIQTSPEAAGIFILGYRIFELQSTSEIIEILSSNGISAKDSDEFIAYFASVFGNLGNYLSFGDTKFIPSIPKDVFIKIVKLTKAYKSIRSIADLYFRLIDVVYSIHPSRLRLAFPPTGLTTYYSDNCSSMDAEIIQKYLSAKRIEAYNTRLFKSYQKNSSGKDVYTLAFASVASHEVEVDDPLLPDSINLIYKYGDYKELMQLIVDGIDRIKCSALNSTQEQMWNEYQKSFYSGFIKDHKEGSKLWVTDKLPAVESYIGFIESYRDPYGVRGEFETFVAIVDREMSIKLQNLVSQAQSLLSLLPWPKFYEKDEFLQPDFTSLDVVSFANSGLPVGINIPNYDDIRQYVGFKNVSLKNVLEARFMDPTAQFILEEDKAIYLANVVVAFEIQVGLHELLGHGSGKLFYHNEDGSFNFTHDTRDLISGGDITNCYESGETWDSKFSSMASPFEECRAECVGLYLGDVLSVLNLFNQDNRFNNSEIVYTNWLSMIRSGLMSLEFYSPSSDEGTKGAWRQAHCQARYAILRVILDAKPIACYFEKITGSDGSPDIRIHLDKDKIFPTTKEAVGSFLQKLQYYKSTGNAVEGICFFLTYSTPSAEHLELRQIVLERKKPRPIYLQPVLLEENSSIALKTYPASNAGMIESFIDRFSPKRALGQAALSALEVLWNREQEYFKNIPV